VRAKMIDAHEFCNSLQSLGGDVQSEKTNTKFARLSINLGELLRELGRLKSRNRAIAELQFAAIVDSVARSIVRTSMSSFAL